MHKKAPETPSNRQRTNHLVSWPARARLPAILVRGWGLGMRYESPNSMWWHHNLQCLVLAHCARGSNMETACYTIGSFHLQLYGSSYSFIVAPWTKCSIISRPEVVQYYFHTCFLVCELNNTSDSAYLVTGVRAHLHVTSLMFYAQV